MPDAPILYNTKSPQLPELLLVRRLRGAIVQTMTTTAMNSKASRMPDIVSNQGTHGNPQVDHGTYPALSQVRKTFIDGEVRMLNAGKQPSRASLGIQERFISGFVSCEKNKYAASFGSAG
ncbi:hypothetical protein MGG_16967 [Pyricularia oryzae 70-15]|uniref:Uncharacterized protein n=1 Tax=Pyricularia oryzae (strain 70-15 / ATCC MYA-4617 / FGSC 8958) TaxID=242507 RepID=G4N2F7_PYRO7|nr:uncharacterized protein MGG_16967 [Pyricularia oryzae 70-15]EHA53362.1 hypothetical protein MGG_16967 [Pyricularia oryzae 70-15]